MLCQQRRRTHLLLNFELYTVVDLIFGNCNSALSSSVHSSSRASCPIAGKATIVNDYVTVVIHISNSSVMTSYIVTEVAGNKLLSDASTTPSFLATLVA